jgi:hypothetical protein
MLNLVLLSALLVAPGCAACKRTSPTASADPITHVVICWCNTPGDAEQVKQIVERSKTFRGIPGVISLRVGPRLQLATTRPIDEVTFDVAIVATFKSAEDLRAYQASPQHEQAVREVLKPMTRKILVYDSVAE